MALHASHLSYLLSLQFLCITLPWVQIFKTMASGSSSSGAPKMAKNVTLSPLERNGLAYWDQKLAMAKRCSHEGVVAGAKAAVLATIATAIPTLASVRMMPWARAYLNHTAQALIISSAAGAAYFIVADKTVLATARKNSMEEARRSNIGA